MEDLNNNSLYESVARTIYLHEWQGVGNDLESEIEQCAHMVDLPHAPSEPDTRVAWQILYASALRLRFDQFGSRADIDKSKALLEPIADAKAIGKHSLLQTLYQLGRTHHMLLFAYGDVKALESAGGLYERALVLCDDSAAHAASIKDEIIIHHAQVLNLFAYIKSSPKDLSAVISDLTDITTRRADCDPLKVNAMEVLSQSYRVHYHVTGQRDLACLLQSEKVGRAAAALSGDLPCHYRVLRSLCSILMDRFSQGGSPKLARESAQLGERFVEWASQKPWLKMADRLVFSSVGSAFNVLMAVDGGLETLRKAATYHRLAVTGMTSRMRGMAYGNMATNYCKALVALADEGGDPKDVDDAVTAGDEALQYYPNDGRWKAFLISNLGTAHSRRYSQAGEEKDFEAAIIYFQQALERSKSVEPVTQDLSDAYHYLSVTYGHKFKLTGEIQYLDGAIHLSEQALQTVVMSMEKPFLLLALGDQLLMRYEVTGMEQNLWDSMSYLENTLDLTREMRYHRHRLLGRYARALRHKYRRTRELKDIELSISLIAEALSMYEGMSYIRRAPYLSELATSHQDRYYHVGDPVDLETALKNYELAADDQAGAIKDRMDAAVAGANLAYAVGRIPESARAFRIAVSLLPRLAWLGLNTAIRQKKLTAADGRLACNAAAVLIQDDQIEGAVELLEEGRSVLWRSILELRTDVHALREVDDSLAEELVAVGRSLEYDESSAPAKSPAQDEQRSQRRRRLAERWNEIVNQVRRLHGFESFLRPAPFARLRQAAQDGPIVIINVSEYRTDAILVSTTQPLECIFLEGLPHNVINNLAYTWQQTLHSVKDSKGTQFLERVLLHVCRTLWYGGFSRIAGALQDHGKRNGLRTPFRVWWLPTGMLSVLPIHCAGPYEAGDPGIHDFFISSYTTTLSALINGQSDHNPSTSSNAQSCSMLAVAQSNVAGFPLLRCAEDEIQEVAVSKFANHITILSGDSATAVQLATELDRHEWLHCCCHARWDPYNPLDSAFRMRDGNLTLSSIVQMRLQKAQFAFLSACHTARHTTLLPDESMHLAAGMQIAGFRGVLATQWGMVDKDGPALTRLFYDYLLKEGMPPDATKAAEALHHSLMKFRANDMPMFRWALFVHVGI